MKTHWSIGRVLLVAGLLLCWMKPTASAQEGEVPQIGKGPKVTEKTNGPQTLPTVPAPSVSVLTTQDRTTSVAVGFQSMGRTRYSVTVRTAHGDTLTYSGTIAANGSVVLLINLGAVTAVETRISLTSEPAPPVVASGGRKAG